MRDSDTTTPESQERADCEAVLRHAFDGQPLDPQIAKRVQERAARVTEEIRRVHGVVNDETFQVLLDDGEDLVVDDRLR
jgi:transcriptional regulator of met regulon